MISPLVKNLTTVGRVVTFTDIKSLEVTQEQQIRIQSQRDNRLHYKHIGRLMYCNGLKSFRYFQE
jgi:hypothetical protein